jgi:aminoglycoside phosphotransferase (APT) family kinase protein
MASMSEEDWDFDYELTNDSVVDLTRACGLRGEVEPLGAGWDYAVFRCDGHALRIPKRREIADAITRELTVLLSLPHDLPLSTPRPQSKLVGIDGLPYPAMVYPLLFGTPLDQGAQSSDDFGLPRPALAEQIGLQLGAFLRSLHNGPVDHERTDIEVDDAEWVAETVVNVAGLRGVIDDHLADRILHRIREPLPADTTRQVLCHGDLLAEHILTDESGNAVAIIDWGDATVGPWWLDFVGLWMWGGDACLHKALATYGHGMSVDEQTHLERRGLMAAISECHHGAAVDPTDLSNEIVPYLRRLLRM